MKRPEKKKKQQFKNGRVQCSELSRKHRILSFDSDVMRQEARQPQPLVRARLDASTRSVGCLSHQLFTCNDALVWSFTEQTLGSCVGTCQRTCQECQDHSPHYLPITYHARVCECAINIHPHALHCAALHCTCIIHHPSRGPLSAAIRTGATRLPMFHARLYQWLIIIYNTPGWAAPLSLAKPPRALQRHRRRAPTRYGLALD
jgi:hypothetical protein